MTTPLPLPRLVVFGEALTDFLHQGNGQWLARPGGACWNVARVAARLGAPTGYAGAISNDVFGDALFADSQAAGLDLRFLQRVDRSPLLAMVTSTQPPHYFFVGDDSADLHFDARALPEGWQTTVEIAHFGCISLAREPLASRLVALAEALAIQGTRITFDPNWRVAMEAPHYTPLFRRMAAIASVIKVSDEDLRHLFPDDTDPLTTLRAHAPQAEILLTLGAAGMQWLHGDRRIAQPAFLVPVVDTVGCGDAAMGGWLASLLQAPNAPAQTHLRQAAAAAALTASHPGAYAGTRAEVEALVALTNVIA
ncbi:carbohydrate kinase family protein (plasmid) [Ralstonia sp. 25C]|uniref:carbohydrate kinase family protein n=1 Tax=Ralstonia sp. 25C TaxID=3447363 RepID=UPI003F750F99